jgi:hypothetical protein
VPPSKLAGGGRRLSLPIPKTSAQGKSARPFVSKKTKKRKDGWVERAIAREREGWHPRRWQAIYRRRRYF